MIVHPLLISLQKPGKRNNQTDLNKFRRLKPSDNRGVGVIHRLASSLRSLLSCPAIMTAGRIARQPM